MNQVNHFFHLHEFKLNAQNNSSCTQKVIYIYIYIYIFT